MKPVARPLIASISVVLAACLVASAALASDRTLAAKEAWRLATENKVTVVDVRSRAEWRMTGVPKGARTVTIHHPDGPAGFVRDVMHAFGGDKDRPIALICARGNRSARALDILLNAGFTNVYHIGEGMLGRGRSDGWLRSGLPVDPCTEC